MSMSKNIQNAYKMLLASMPLLGAIAMGIMWVDTRYMHKEISDTRFIELQIKIIEGQLKYYHGILDGGGTLSAQDQIKYQLETEQLRELQKERNKILGIGERP